MAKDNEIDEVSGQNYTESSLINMLHRKMCEKFILNYTKRLLQHLKN